MIIDVYPPSTLEWQGRHYRCALGSGVSRVKVEGDGLTPVGRFPLRGVFYRADRLAPPVTRLAVKPIGHKDGWCDAPEDRLYNRFVTLPFGASHEVLWRDDGVYDLVAVVGYNDDPVIPGLGSAIFLHVAKPDYAPTEGCVALALDDLLAVLKDCGPETQIRINPPTV